MIFLVYSNGRDTGLLRFDRFGRLGGTNHKMALSEFAKYFGLIEEFDETMKNINLVELFKSYRGPEKFYAIITAKGTIIKLNDDFLGVEDIY